MDANPFLTEGEYQVLSAESDGEDVVSWPQGDEPVGEAVAAIQKEEYFLPVCQSFTAHREDPSRQVSPQWRFEHGVNTDACAHEQNMSDGMEWGSCPFRRSFGMGCALYVPHAPEILVSLEGAGGVGVTMSRAPYSSSVSGAINDRYTVSVFTGDGQTSEVMASRTAAEALVEEFVATCQKANIVLESFTPHASDKVSFYGELIQ